MYVITAIRGVRPASERSPPDEDWTGTRHFTRGPDTPDGAFTQQLRLRAPEIQTPAASVSGDRSGLAGMQRREQRPGFYGLPAWLTPGPSPPSPPSPRSGHAEHPRRLSGVSVVLYLSPPWLILVFFFDPLRYTEICTLLRLHPVRSSIGGFPL
jgi:hypothetical protein